MELYDIVILGGGPGGYIAAIRAAQLGKRTALVEKEKLGGTCLHKGCIPSKTLLRSAELFETMKRSGSFGIRAEGLSLDFGGVQSRKDSIVEQLEKGVQFLMKKNAIDVYSGTGHIVDGTGREAAEAGCNGVINVTRGTIQGNDGVDIAGDTGEEAIRIGYRDLIVATGSRPRRIAGLPSHERVMSSDEALAMTDVPASIVIVGGGVIGVEWASMLSDFGAQVTIVEAAERIVPTEDADISRELSRLFAKRKIKVLTGAKLLAESVAAGEAGVTLEIERGGKVDRLAAERMLVSVGRAANVEGFGLERTAAKVERGVIAVDPASMRTADPHVYAIGDVIGGLQLAHVASHEGVAAVEAICGLETHAPDPASVPKCVYSRPELASVGLTEQAAVDSGREVKVGKFSFKAIGKALVFGESDGFVKVVADAANGAVLGVHMIGPHVTDFIGEAALAQLLEATSMQVGRMIHPHPTLSEIIGEAMLGADKLALGM
ncbi:dihydrolipoyl dehydrogenase [Paenibacillus glycanilyticus]|uniref:Dihydrolipoyl dehydrogenase n=1 Tax=Paenibacillus glycanilyticus TaxID=126569 RepID=A0ABQ6GFI8_9BACL|nr:dihydrolipoyl dehydrogenase [Paenibacillus glycanilyticus]GLX69721.1 dihydrolipoyl dehydrogenase [Paenibacillus glycanilyticus]